MAAAAVWGTGSNGVSDIHVQSDGALCPHNDDGTTCPRCAVYELESSATTFIPITLNEGDVEKCVRRLSADQRDTLMENPEKILLAGGFIRSVISGANLRDVDIFVNGEAEAVRIANVFKSWIKDPHFITTETAVTVAGPVPTQFIHRFPFQDPTDVLRSFDFTVAQAALWFGLDSKWRGMCARSYYHDLAAKRLVYTCPVRDDQDVRVIGRLLKHVDLGYVIDRFALCRLVAAVVRNTAQKKETLADVLDAEALEKGFMTDLLKSSVSPDFAELCHISREDRKGAFVPVPPRPESRYSDWGS